jgi:hypothetical protein
VQLQPRYFAKKVLSARKIGLSFRANFNGSERMVDDYIREVQKQTRIMAERQARKMAWRAAFGAVLLLWAYVTWFPGTYPAFLTGWPTVAGIFAFAALAYWGEYKRLTDD